MINYDFVIVGAGLYGCTCAERLHKAGARVLLLEKKNHLGGTCYSEEIDGIDVHWYGPHVFHTENFKIWEYITQFSSFRQFTHKAMTVHDAKHYCWPINLSTINNFFGINLKPFEVDGYMSFKQAKIIRPKNFEEKVISMIGTELYEAFIKHYTEKQWSKSPSDLSESLIQRIIVRPSYYDGYYDDYYQGVPTDTYKALFDNMTKDLHFELNTDFFNDMKYWKEKTRYVIYTGPIDQYFSYCYGALEWRSLRFELEVLPQKDFQGISTLQIPDPIHEHTRQVEYKHFHPFKTSFNAHHTLVAREYSCIDKENPLYPIPTNDNSLKLLMYKELIKKENNVFFGGRLAEYKYYDMDDVIKKALFDIAYIYTKLKRYFK